MINEEIVITVILKILIIDVMDCKIHAPVRMLSDEYIYTVYIYIYIYIFKNIYCKLEVTVRLVGAGRL